MKSHTQILITLLVLALTLSACTPQATAVPPTDTPQPAPTVIPLPPTATPLPPMLMVGGDVPCYAGPGPSYDTLATLVIGAKVEVLSKDSTGEYWIVQSPAGNGQCWTESRYATIIGSSEEIPVLAADAVPTQVLEPPDELKNLHSKVTCTTIRATGSSNHGQASGKLSVTVTLNWPDVLTETGYRIYKDGLLLTELPANTLEYVDYFEISKGSSTNIIYKVEVFNQDGVSSSPEVDVLVNYFGCK